MNRAKKLSECGEEILEALSGESGKIGYVVLWFLGAPMGLLVVLWLFLGNNIFGPG